MEAIRPFALSFSCLAFLTTLASCAGLPAPEDATKTANDLPLIEEDETEDQAEDQADDGMAGPALPSHAPAPVALGLAADAPHDLMRAVDGADVPDGDDAGVVVAAAGDVATPGGAQARTARLLLDLIDKEKLAAVLGLGDLAYQRGTLAEYRKLYDPTWGVPAIRSLTHPVPGNHEYAGGSGGKGYFDYFNGEGEQRGQAGQRGEGWYSFDLGGWHIVALNSGNGCKRPSCAEDSEQVRWLKDDLARHPNRCTLAYWHHPRFQSGAKHGDTAETAPPWNALYDAGADVVLTGHEHNFQQFAPMDKNGRLDPQRGVRSWVVGTGGRGFMTGFNPRHGDALEKRLARANGVLALTLHPTRYSWRFIDLDGKPQVQGSDDCH